MKYVTGWIVSISLFCSLSAFAGTGIVYVAQTSPTDGPGTAWSNAFHTIQGGIDAATGPTGIVLVADGTYDTGSEAAYGMNLQNRVFIDKSLITVKSVNGPEVTIIKGQGPNGDNAVRCVFIAPRSTLSGFTLTGGHTRTTGVTDEMGGGVYGYTNSVIENCILTDNSADLHGGAAYSGIFNQCIITNNSAGSDGGGTYESILNNCTLSGNSATSAGGARDSTLNNCILWDNNALPNGDYDWDNWYNCTLNYSCTTPLPTNGTSNIDSDPQFVSSNDLHLATSSPCIDRGSTVYVQGTTDLDGNERIYDGDRDGNAYVDMGCYESIIKDTWYVDPSSPSEGPGTSWSNAFHSIQSAISSAADDDIVLVTNGLYNTSGLTIHDDLGSRVGLNKAITVRSVNGPEVTTIAGWGGMDGPDARRCAYVGTNAVLAGFTLTNGHTRTTGTPQTEQSGGGVWCEDSGMVSNCIIVGNTAHSSGGGAYHGTLSRCILRGNSAEFGGGAYDATLNNSLLISNSASIDGGGAYNGTFNNCTIAQNTASGVGGGVYNAILNNSISWSNTASSSSNWIGGTFNYCCTAPLPGGSGNITNDPLFDTEFELPQVSPCVDKGTNTLVQGKTDLIGTPRILDSGAYATTLVDMGCYEYLNTLADSDRDGMLDGWELDNSLSPVDALDSILSADSDPASNFEEYIADTDPNDSNSYFTVLAISNDPFRVYFKTSQYRSYGLFSCTNLSAGTWTNVGPWEWGNGSIVSREDTNNPTQKTYYKAIVVH